MMFPKRVILVGLTVALASLLSAAVTIPANKAHQDKPEPLRPTISSIKNSATVPALRGDGTVEWPLGYPTDEPARPRFSADGTASVRSVNTPPGEIICGPGTPYDVQSNDDGQRRIATLGGYVHFVWINESSVPTDINDIDRYVNYRCWFESGAPENNCGTSIILGNPVDARFGYPSIDLSSSGQSHVTLHGKYQPCEFPFICPYTSYIFNEQTECNDVLWDEEFTASTAPEAIWPHIAIDRGGSTEKTPGDDVFHVCSRSTGETGYPEGALLYWRRVGGFGNWWVGPVVLDVEAHNSYNHHVAVDPTTTRISVYYIKDGLDPNNLLQVGYLESPDNGANWIAAGGFPNPIEPTVGPYVNVSNYSGDPSENPQAWLECTGEYDLNGNRHAVWVEQWRLNSLDCRLKHWDDVHGTATIQEAFGWQNVGRTGSRDLWLSSPVISFGDGSTMCTADPGDGTNYNYIYVTFEQYGGPTTTEANDVSKWNYQNLELYSTASYDDGLSWSRPLNLTNTHTPDCDTIPGNECWSERDPSVAILVNDTMHISYILDQNAGDAVFGQSFWTLNPVMYDRIPGGTDAPVICPQVSPEIYVELTNPDPDCEFHAGINVPPLTANATLSIANLGNAALSGSITKTNNSDWLVLTTGAYSVAPGAAPSMRPVVMNASAPSITGEGLYQDQLEITHNDTGVVSPIIIPVDFFVFDEFNCPEDTTLHTQWLWLSASNIARVAEQNGPEQGLARLDPSTGDSSYSIHDGSLIIGLPPDPDTLVYRYIYGEGNGAKGFHALSPLSRDLSAYGTGAGQATATANLTTTDSSLGVHVEYDYPQSSDSSEFVVIKYYMTNNTAATINGIAVGQATDFDVTPNVNQVGSTQPGFQNTGHLKSEYNLVYQEGVDTVGHVISGDQTATRFKAGMAALQGMPSPRAWIAPNDPWLYATATPGFAEGYLWQHMTEFGFELFPPSNPHPEEDLHSVLVFEKGLNLSAGDSRAYAMAYVSSITGTDESDLIATTRKAWKYAFGWWIYTPYDSLGETTLTKSYPYAIIGSHEDGLPGGCSGCIVSKVSGDPELTITPGPDPCRGTIDLNASGPFCMVQATFRATDLCQNYTDDIYVEIWMPGVDCCECPHQGDLNIDTVRDALDLNALIDALFFGGSIIQDPWCPTSRSDLNNDGFPDALDLNYMIEHLFFGGPPPVDPCNP